MAHGAEAEDVVTGLAAALRGTCGPLAGYGSTVSEIGAGERAAGIVFDVEFDDWEQAVKASDVLERVVADSVAGVARCEVRRSVPPQIDMDGVVFAVYHCGGIGRLVEYMEIAAACQTSPQQIDAPLAEAVDAGLLERDESPATHRLAFRLTQQGTGTSSSDLLASERTHAISG